MKGAEAIVRNGRILEKPIVIKDRICKSYRIPEIDVKLRKERTKQEARLLHRAKIAGVKCPVILFVDEFALGMTKLKGKRPKMKREECLAAGGMLGKLHNANVIHGDFTPANLILQQNELFVIDFGLGFFSSDIEDKAIDVLTMLKAIKGGADFLEGYCATANDAKKIIERVEEVKKRARYA